MSDEPEFVMPTQQQTNAALPGLPSSGSPLVTQAALLNVPPLSSTTQQSPQTKPDSSTWFRDLSELIKEAQQCDVPQSLIEHAKLKMHERRRGIRERDEAIKSLEKTLAKKSATISEIVTHKRLVEKINLGGSNSARGTTPNLEAGSVQPRLALLTAAPSSTAGAQQGSCTRLATPRSRNLPSPRNGPFN
jgi:hypothetical protein